MCEELYDYLENLVECAIDLENLVECAIECATIWRMSDYLENERKFGRMCDYLENLVECAIECARSFTIWKIWKVWYFYHYPQKIDKTAKIYLEQKHLHYKKLHKKRSECMK